MSASVPSIDLDMKELVDTFALDAAPAKVSMSPTSSPRKNSVLTLLDTYRANNIRKFLEEATVRTYSRPSCVAVIMLSRMKPSLPEIKRALLSIDDSVLNIDDLKAIARHLPTSLSLASTSCIREGAFAGAELAYKVGQFDCPQGSTPWS